MPIIGGGGGGGGGGAISGVTVTGVAASGDVPVASSAAAGAWSFPPGLELGYAQVTVPTNIVDTAEATGTPLISSGAITFDGSPVMCEFFSVVRTTASSSNTVFSLFEGATQITELTAISLAVAVQDILPVQASFRFTPTAGSHTYALTAFVTSTTGTPRLNAGSGGTGGNPPAYLRFTKV